MPVPPMDRSILLPAVATADVVEAIVSALSTTARGPFNLAAPTVALSGSARDCHAH